MKPCGRSFTIDQRDDEDQRIGQHRDDAPTAGPAAMPPTAAAPSTGPSKVPTPPSITDRKACTRKRDADVGRELIERHDQRAGEPGKRGAEGEGQA